LVGRLVLGCFCGWWEGLTVCPSSIRAWGASWQLILVTGGLDITKQVVVRSAIGLAVFGKAAPHCIHDRRRAAVGIGSLFALSTTAKRGGYCIRNTLVESFPWSTRSACSWLAVRLQAIASSLAAPARGQPEIRKHPSAFTRLFCASNFGLRLPHIVDLLQPCYFEPGLVVTIRVLLRFKTGWASGLGVLVQLDATRPCKLSFPAPPQGYRARAAGGLGQALSTRLACPQRLIREQPPLSGLGNAAAWAN
jgi:hypothetical protein